MCVNSLIENHFFKPFLMITDASLAQKPRIAHKLRRAIAVLLALPFLLMFKLKPRDFRQLSEILSLIHFSIGKRIRYELYPRTLAACGGKVTVHFGTILGYRAIKLGNNIPLGAYNI